MITLLELDFLRNALFACVLIGLAAPAVGTFVVQRRLSLLGDGIGHIALTGVAMGFLTQTSPVLTAVVASVVGAIVIEWLRNRARTGGDVALALLFYGGIAGGVLLTNLAPGGSSANLLGYLFGSVSSVTLTDLYIVAALAVVVLATVAVFGRELFVLCHDEEVARASGLPVRFLSMLLAVTAALTVVVAMRVVGLLLVSALMVVPVAAAQQLTRGFRTTALAAMALGVGCAIGGLYTSVQYDLAPGPVIVMLALGAFILAVLSGHGLHRGRAFLRKPRRSRAFGAGHQSQEPAARETK
jgi:zinc transport system permease protein